MSRLQIGFDNPGYLLLLLLLLPAVWLWSRPGRSRLGSLRWLAAVFVRTVVVLLSVLALAEIQLLQTSDKVTAIYLLDQSESIPLVKRQAMLAYTIQAVARHRDSNRQDRAGVILFGRTASMQVPPFDEDILVLDGVESYVNLRTDATNLESALKLAKASFPEDAAKRIVIVSDGNENLGSARAAAASLAEDGIGVDVVPVQLEARAEVAVEKVTLPPDIRQGQPIEARVVLDNYADRPLSGTLRVTRRLGPREELLSEQDVELRPGKNVYSFGHKIDQTAVYTYQAEFVPRDPREDGLTQNNRATAFTHVRGQGRVLLIENWQTPGEFDYLVERLRQNQIEVTVQSSAELFTSLAELQSYDAVILANVPRSSGDDAESLHAFSDQQIDMLVRNTEQMGCGLIMLGGPNSFGAGAWSNTALERAMPVDFQIKNQQLRAVGALAMMMHASEIPEGNYWQKEVAKQAIQALGPLDYCGLIHWDTGGNRWLWTDESGNGVARVAERRNMMLRRLGTMIPGDMPEFDPGMRMSLMALNRVPASAKLMIVISDGDPSPPSAAVVNAIRNAGIQVTTVAIGAHGPAGHQTLQELAEATGGRYYVVTDARALPKYYVSEVRRVARPLVYEPQTPVQPRVVYSHEILQGIDGPLPPISGFVLTTVKENPLVEVAALSPEPADERNSTVLAAWTYGLGRTAVLTTDAGRRWAASWTQWDNYDKFFTQLVRWAMRPVGEEGQFAVTTDLRDGRVRVVVTALDTNDQFLNFLNIAAAGVGPDLESFEPRIRQVAPGRYVGEFPATKEGSYFLTVNPGPGYSPLLAGVNVPYSAEFRDRETNLGLLQALADLRPAGGQPGQIASGDLGPENFDELLRTNSFRRELMPAASRQDVWPGVLLLGACLFFVDVLIRRVVIGWEWWKKSVAWVRDRLLRREAAGMDDERLERLRTRKAEVAEAIDERRAAARFAPDVDAADIPPSVEQLVRDTAVPRSPPTASAAPPSVTPAAPEAESYTERLLKAKRKAWKDERQDAGDN